MTVPMKPFDEKIPCKECDGSGMSIDMAFSECDGIGKVGE